MNDILYILACIVMILIGVLVAGAFITGIIDRRRIRDAIRSEDWEEVEEIRARRWM